MDTGNGLQEMRITCLSCTSAASAVTRDFAQTRVIVYSIINVSEGDREG